MLIRPALLLRIEEAALLAAAIAVYAHFHFSWVLFGALFLAPDLFMLGYLGNPRMGAAIYNLGHFLPVPMSVFAAGYFAHRPLAKAIGILWAAHIAFDRMLGYGLKYPARFNDTHLQHIA